MKTKQYHKHNFHKHTFCVFKEVSIEVTKDLNPNYSSKSGSKYYFLEEGLYRVSNHWGRASNCRWKLEASSVDVDGNLKRVQTKVGYAKWTDFYPNNEHENLFYIAVNFETKSVDFYHKNNPAYDGKSICRNAAETSKRIKICKEVLLEERWANYLHFNTIESLKKEIISELLTTNFSFIDIKKKYLK